MTLQELCKIAVKQARDKGFHDTPLLPLEALMLICSEVAEAAEAVREGAPTYYFKDTQIGAKPEGIAAELADVVIRVADFCGAHNIDLQTAVNDKLAYNAKRPYKHGKLK